MEWVPAGSQQRQYREDHNRGKETKPDACGCLPLAKRGLFAAVEKWGQEHGAKGKTRKQRGADERPPARKIFRQLIQKKKIPFRSRAVLGGEVDFSADRGRKRRRKQEHSFDREQHDDRHLEEIERKESIFAGTFRH